VGIDTIFRLLSNFVQSVLINNLKVELKLINSNNVLSREVLQRSREESLWEEETRNPIASGCAFLNPLTQELDSF